MFAAHQKPILPAVIVATVLLSTAIENANAGGVLDHLPKNTLGFVVVNDLSAVDGEIDHLQRMFSRQYPSPLTYFKFITGLEAGIDEHGAMLIALLPATNGAPFPQPIVWLEVSDYAQFAQSLNGDPSGGISQITIAGEAVLIAHHGEYALITNVEHRATMLRLLAAKPAPVASLQPIAKWLASVDVAMVLQKAGFETILNTTRKQIAMQSAMWKKRSGNSNLPGGLGQIQQSLELYDILVRSRGRKIDVAAVGLELDKKSGAALGIRLLFANRPAAAGKERIVTNRVSHLTGFSDQPFVTVASSTIAPEWGETIAKVTRLFMEQSSESQGYEDFSEQQWKEVEKIVLSVVRPVNAVSVLMQPGQKKDPFFSNGYLILSVADAEEYLETIKQFFHDWNVLGAASTSDIQYEYKVSPTTLDGAKAIEIVAHIAEAAADENVPAVAWLMEALLGEDGKLSILAVAVDEHTVVLGMSSREKVRALVKDVKNQDRGLSDSADVKTTLQQLGGDATTQVLVSPQGAMQWYGRWLSEFLSHLTFAGNIQEIPECPATPPVGLTLNLLDSQVEADLVWPAETLSGLADFARSFESD